MWWYAEGRYWAELGFIAVMLDGQGGPFRSKRIHDVTYRNISDCGTPDRIAAIRELAATRPFMDLDRVGIVGHSGGGFGAARALFDHPDFYKVGVASSGSHDLRAYGTAFAEQFMGRFDEAPYAAHASAASAPGLRGKLLLSVGDLDENTHPALTLGLVRALIDANKDFDLLMYPGGDHTVIGRGYYLRRHWDYMVRNLLGAEPPREYELWDPRSGKPPKARHR
jgi:dipeptidyl aminopeptidase/acylaminoacyl peptidase